MEKNHKIQTMAHIDEITIFKLVIELYEYNDWKAASAWILLSMNFGIYSQFMAKNCKHIINAIDSRVQLCLVLMMLYRNAISQADYCDALVIIFDENVLKLEEHSKLQQTR